jgi:hypothetical protein
MPIAVGQINRNDMIFHLREAKQAIDALADEIAAGKHDHDGAVTLGFPFEHIMNHLCAAWHSKWMSPHDIENLTDDQYHQMTSAVPNWGLRLELVDIHEPSEFDRREG